MKGSVNQFSFTRFIENVIKVTIQKYNIIKNDIIIFLDNASAHNSNYTLTSIRSTGVKIFFNSPYSPALNVIELIFGDFKIFIRKKDNSNSH